MQNHKGYNTVTTTSVYCQQLMATCSDQRRHLQVTKIKMQFYTMPYDFRGLKMISDGRNMLP